MDESMLNYSVAIMFIMSLVLAYYITTPISLDKYITNSRHKFYMGLFMAFQMGLIELGMYYYFMGTINFYLLTILLAGLIYTGYKLRTLNFLDDKQFMLAMIEHHANALAMSNAHNYYYRTTNKEIQDLINTILTSQDDQIKLMYRLLKNY